MKTFSVLIFLFFSQFAALNAQQTQLGISVKSTDNEVVPFSIITCKNKGWTCDSLGIVKIVDFNNNDTCIIHALGFKEKLFKPSDFKSSTITIKMVADVYELEPVTIKPMKRVLLGCKKKRDDNNGCALKPGHQKAMYFSNPGKVAFINSVSFYITKAGFPQVPFRLRIYEVDSATGTPGKDILTENILLHATIGGEWVTYSLANLNLYTQAKGFFVAYEWVLTDEKYFWSCHENPVLSYGSVIGSTMEYKTTFSWYKYYNSPWGQSTWPDGIKVRMNPMIRAEVMFR